MVLGLIEGYFEGIFLTSFPYEGEIVQVISRVPPTFTDEINNSLVRHFQIEEVLRALKKIHPSKAPRPDGLCGAFY